MKSLLSLNSYSSEVDNLQVNAKCTVSNNDMQNKVLQGNCRAQASWQKKKKLSEDVTKEQSKGKSFPDIENSTYKGFHIVLL